MPCCSSRYGVCNLRADGVHLVRGDESDESACPKTESAFEGSFLDWLCAVEI